MEKNTSRVHEIPKRASTTGSATQKEPQAAASALPCSPGRSPTVLQVLGTPARQLADWFRRAHRSEVHFPRRRGVGALLTVCRLLKEWSATRPTCVARWISSPAHLFPARIRRGLGKRGGGRRLVLRRACPRSSCYQPGCSSSGSQEGQTCTTTKLSDR